MDNTLTVCAAVDETVVFLNYFKDLHDPRRDGAKLGEYQRVSASLGLFSNLWG
jgi:hypothetical protein